MRTKKESVNIENMEKSKKKEEQEEENIREMEDSAQEEKDSRENNISEEIEVSLIDEESKEEAETKYNDSELKNKVEAILFSSGKPLSIEMIQQLVGVNDKKIIKKALEELKGEYEKKRTSLMLIDEIIDNKEHVKLTVRENYMPFVSKIVADTELSKTVIETLAIIAWKAPVKQSEVITIRTNKAYDHIDELERLGFITREKSGRTFNIKLSQKFYDYFDLRNKKQLEETFEKVKEKTEEKEKVDFEKKEKKREEHEKEQREQLGNLDVYLQELDQKKMEKPVEKEKSLMVEEKRDVAVLNGPKKALAEEKQEIVAEVPKKEEESETKEESEDINDNIEEKEDIKKNSEEKQEDKKQEVADDYIEGPLEQVAKKRGRKKKQAE
jgi:segregation and condensation protein B